MLHTDGQANGRRGDVLLGKFFRAELRVGGGVGMDDQALDIGHVGEQGEDLEVVDETPGVFLRALDLKSENGAGSLREIATVQRVVVVFGQGRVVDFRHLRVLGEVLDDLEGVLGVALDAQREGFDPGGESTR